MLSYASLCGRCVPTFQDNLSVPSSRVKKSILLSFTSSPLKMGPIGCPETSVHTYHSRLRNIPEDRRSDPRGYASVFIGFLFRQTVTDKMRWYEISRTAVMLSSYITQYGPFNLHPRSLGVSLVAHWTDRQTDVYTIRD
jgi:hypothetical protein